MSFPRRSLYHICHEISTIKINIKDSLIGCIVINLVILTWSPHCRSRGRMRAPGTSCSRMCRLTQRFAQMPCRKVVTITILFILKMWILMKSKTVTVTKNYENSPWNDSSLSWWVSDALHWEAFSAASLPIRKHCPVVALKHPLKWW